MDVRFKVVRESVYQLFSVHSIARSGEDMKEIPLLFALMSRRRTKDYLAIIQSIVEKLEKTSVQRIVADFEVTSWKAFKDSFPHAQIEGCSFRASDLSKD